MLFSVVIPIYNKEAYLRDTVESVLGQTEGDYELILVDDGSTDGSLRVAESFDEPRIRIIRKPNGGVSSARNAGIRAARGEYVCLLDADDLWLPRYLETIRWLIGEYGGQAGAFFTGYRIRTAKGVVTPDFTGVYRGRSTGILEDYFAAAAGRYAILNSSCIAVRKSLFDVVGYYDEDNSVGEDLEVQMKIAMATSYAFSSEVLSEYNRTTGDNARTRNRVFYPKSYLEYIDSLIRSEDATPAMKRSLTHIKNRKFVPYIYTLILSREKREAMEVLKRWQPRDKYLCYKAALRCCIFLPNRLLGFVKNRYYGA